MSRIDQYQVNLVGPNGEDWGLWLTYDGGGVDSEETSTRDAYGLPKEQLGGAQTIDNHTLSRTFKTNRDPSVWPTLKKGCGRIRLSGNVQLLDIDGFAVGKPDPFQGMLKSAKKAAVNIEGSDAMKITIEISADGAPA
jgi:hypothetical protein